MLYSFVQNLGYFFSFFFSKNWFLLVCISLYCFFNSSIFYREFFLVVFCLVYLSSCALLTKLPRTYFISFLKICKYLFIYFFLMLVVIIYLVNSQTILLYYGDPFLVSRSFFSISLFFFIAGSICSFMVILPYLFSSRSKINIKKLFEYECGFKPFDSATRQPFSIHFYIVGIIFLIFDVELALLFPFSIFLVCLDWFSYFVIIFFLSFLIIGFIYEWQIGAITWIVPEEKKIQLGVAQYAYTTFDSNV